MSGERGCLTRCVGHETDVSDEIAILFRATKSLVRLWQALFYPTPSFNPDDPESDRRAQNPAKIFWTDRPEFLRERADSRQFPRSPERWRWLVGTPSQLGKYGEPECKMLRGTLG